jgi:hypothetical protein
MTSTNFENRLKAKLLMFAMNFGSKKIGRLPMLNYYEAEIIVEKSIKVFKFVFVILYSVGMFWFFTDYLVMKKGVYISIISLLLLIVLYLFFGRIKTKSI